MTETHTQRFYILDEDGRTPMPVDSVLDWAKWFETAIRTVDFTQFENVGVSTVFLGLNHRYIGSGPPLLWETMIFGGEHDDYQERYSSYADAVAGHAKACSVAFGAETIA